MDTLNEVQLDPIPSILIESMRDIGYSFESALADIIDNSITANAKHIKILARNEAEPILAIVDDGDGLKRGDLLAAMRMGSTDPRDVRKSTDLGRFGLGMKTASFSQCRKLTVASFCNGESSAFVWDLDYVVSENAWKVLETAVSDQLPFYEDYPSNGTAVIWENLDRVGGNLKGKKPSNSFERLVSDAEDHIALVFHRFLAGEPGCPKVEITLNGRPIEPLDPFNRKHSATIPGPEEPLPGGVVVQSFTLPHKTKYSSSSEYDKYGLRGGYLKNQGIYLYRAKRLIIHGTWFNLAKKTPITQLCRVRIDIDNAQDEDWKIDIKKVSAQLPEEARETIKRLLNRFNAPSKSVYKRHGARQTTSASYPTWVAIKDNGMTRYEINRSHPIIKELSEELGEAESRKLEIVLKVIESNFPLSALFVDMSSEPEKVTTPAVDEGAFADAAKDFFAYLKAAGMDEQDILEKMRMTPLFSDRWEEVLGALNVEEG